MADHDTPPPPQDAAGPTGATLDAAALQALARDWVTIWQSELAAAGLDREVQEAWQAMLAQWAGASAPAMAAWIAPSDAGRPRPRPAAAPGPPAAAAAPDAGRDAAERHAAELRRLAARVAELERRLAGLDRT